MKIVCIFGDNTVASRERFFKIIEGVKKKNWEHVSVSSDRNLSEQLVGSSLFGGDTLFSVSNATKLQSREYDWIKLHADKQDGSLLLFFPAAIPAAVRKTLPKTTKYEEFKLQTKLFIFLESVYPGNAKSAVKLLSEIIVTDPPEMVLSLLARQMRDLAWVKSGETSNIPDWRRRKLLSQANRFSGEQLKTFVNALSKADIDSKTGRGELPILLDLAIIKYL